MRENLFVPSDQDRGSLPLYMAILLPIVCCMAILAVDVSAFQALRERAQKESDRIALQAAQALPDTVLAEQLLRSSVSRLKDLSISKNNQGVENIIVTSSGITFGLEGKVDAFFDVFLSASGSGQTVFRVEEQASVQLVPEDNILIISDSANLRPLPAQYWGEEAQWPESKYFNFVHAPENIDLGETVSDNPAHWNDWWQHWPEYKRWATQTCYNPAFSPLKFAAVSLSDILSSYGVNRLGAIFTPGDNATRGFSTIRDLRFFAGDPQAQAAWASYFERQSYVSDEACVYFADASLSAEERYGLPPAPAFVFLGNQSCQERINYSGWGDLYYPAGRLAPCFRDQSLSLREAIYFRAARDKTHSPRGENIIAAINEAFLQLVQADQDQLNTLASARGNISAQSYRKIILLSEQIPDPQLESFSQALARLSANNIQLILIPFAHEHLPQEQIDLLDERLQALKALGLSKVAVYRADTAEELAEVVIPRVSSFKREYALRS